MRTTKILFSKILIVVTLLNMLGSTLIYAEPTDMRLYLDGQNQYLYEPLEKISNAYYLLGYNLDYGNNDFEYTEGNGEIMIFRYGTELRITFGSDTVFVNGQSQLFSTPVYRTNNQNYISLTLIASIFGNNITVNEPNNIIDITLNPKPVLPNNKCLNGTLSLPNDTVAPDSGMAFKVSVENVRSDVYPSNPANNYKYVLLDAGQNKANFTCNIEDNNDYGEYVVTYQLLDNYNFDNYSEYGYYSYCGTRSQNNKRSKILIGESTHINLNVIEKIQINGIISKDSYLGQINIYAYAENDNYIDSYWTYNSNFNISVPKDIEKISLRYNLYANTDYIKEGYYSKNGSVPFHHQKDFIHVKEDDLNNITLNLIQGKVISGTVYYPDSMVDTYDYINIRAITDDGNYCYTSYTKNEGEGQLDYKIIVPLYGTNKYTLSLNSNFIGSSVYLDENGKLVSDPTNAKEFDVTNGDIQNADMHLETPRIFGTIYLPDKELAPSGGIDIEISIGEMLPTPKPGKPGSSIPTVPVPSSLPTVTPQPVTISEPFDTNQVNALTSSQSIRNIVTTIVTIPEGQSTIDYELPFELIDVRYKDKLIAAFHVLNNPSYSGDNTYLIEYPYNYNQQIDTTLVRLKQISGAISLPDGATAKEDINIKVFADAYYSNITIEAGQTSRNYTLALPENRSFRIGYTAYDYPQFLNGYYSSGKTVYDRYDSDWIDSSDPNLSNINMEILKAPCISGIVTVPDGITLPTEGLDVTITSADYSGSTTLNIPQGERSSPYKLYIQKEKIYNTRVQYAIDSDTDGLWDGGYYAQNGITLIPYKGKLINLQNNIAENINFTLMKRLQLTGEVKLPNNRTALSDIYGYIYAEQNPSIHPINSVSTSTSQGISPELDVERTDFADSSSKSSGGGSVIVVPAAPAAPLIPAGQNSGTYTTYMPDDCYFTNYTLHYELGNSDEYYQKGYYTAPNSCSSLLWNATHLLPDTNGTTITLLDTHTITGTLSRPQNYYSDIFLTLAVLPKLNGYLQEYQQLDGCALQIENGIHDVSYTIDVPSDITECAIKYYVEDDTYPNFLVDYGYYANGNIVKYHGEAEILTVSDHISNINFTPLTKEPTDGNILKTVKVLNNSGYPYSISDSIYNKKQFSVILDNIYNQLTDGTIYTIYVSLYDHTNKLIDTITSDISGSDSSRYTIRMQFNNDPPPNTSKMKVMVWDASMNPLSEIFEILGPDPITVMVNGKKLNLAIPPTIVDGRTLIPFKPIAEELGADVTYDIHTQRMTAVKDGITIELSAGNHTTTINGKMVTLDVAPLIIGSELMVPVRFISESLGCDVTWDEATQTVHLSN